MTVKSESSVKRLQGALVRYLRETWFELKKVSWPNRKEARNLTIMVIVVTSVLAVILGRMDWVYSTVLGLLL